LRVKFVGRRDNDSIDLFVLEQLFKSSIGTINFQFLCNLLSALSSDIRDGHEPGLRDEPPKVFGVPFAHFADTENAYPKFPHENSPAKS
jgi:hypothetical protein